MKRSQQNRERRVKLVLKQFKEDGIEELLSDELHRNKMYRRDGEGVVEHIKGCFVRFPSYRIIECWRAAKGQKKLT